MIATILFEKILDLRTHAMAWEKAVALQTLQDAGRITLTLNQQKLLLIWHEDKVHVVQAQCPHLKLPLKKAKITEKCALVCPFHKSTFDLNTGDVVSWSPWPPIVGPLLAKASCPKPLQVYESRVDGQDVFVNTKI
jgi:nitrite reductase/ring-hydroxylating ferredoxin subunit